MLLASIALALDCSDTATFDDPVLCDAVEQAVTDANAVFGSSALHDAAPSARRPETVYHRMAALRDAATDGGCTLSSAIHGVGVASWNDRSWTGSWRDIDGGTGSHSGTARSNRVQGAFDGDESGAVGESWGLYNAAGRVAANRGSGFVAGHWIRVRGRRGVFVGLQGTCDGGTPAYEALDDWYGGGLRCVLAGGDPDGDGACVTRYLDPDATGLGDGSSWADAFTELETAVAATGTGEALWVAEGRYLVSDGLFLPDGVVLYGGFDGTETTFDERREWFDHTVITGDTLGDDVPFDLASRADNRDGPLVYSGNGAVLDGFRISGGYSTTLWGAAIRMLSGDTMTGRNLRIVDNVTPTRAAYHVGTNTGLHLSDSLVMHNQANQQPTGRYEPFQVASSLVNVVITDNRGSGGTLWIDSNTMDIVGTTVDEPDVTGATVGFGSSTSADFLVANSLFWGTGNNVFSGGGPLEMVNNCLEEDASAYGTGNLLLDGGTAATGDPLVRLPSGERYLSTDTVCSDAGDDGFADLFHPGWDAQTTLESQAVDASPVDIGAHAEPNRPRVQVFENQSGTLVWEVPDATACWIDGAPVATSGSMPVLAAWYEIDCVGTVGDTRAVYFCDGDVASGDTDFDGVCDG